MLPGPGEIRILFAHAAYQLQERFRARGTGMASIEVRDRAALEREIGNADVLVISGLWRNELLERSGRLRFIQSISAGMDQYAKDALAARGVRLASAAGANAGAVAQHAMALVLALARRLPEARDNQAKTFWRGMIGDRTRREDELGGKVMVIVGLGRIGGRLARLAKAFGMRVIGTRRDPTAGANGADDVFATSRLGEILGEADFMVLTCPLTPETNGLIGAEALGRMRRSAYLVNVARGACVDEAALVAALAEGRIAGAALDCVREEPLATDSVLWAMPNVLITPHTAGETRAYEDNVLDLMMENLSRLWRGQMELMNQVI
ncbi:MAG TPA: D-2-hydroxyacid dehydrogenase [Acetobacteraceae bacterium]|nr:D-2-hydroxyacid dehydrogenase [Acetobacteraceae bacterium]